MTLRDGRPTVGDLVDTVMHPSRLTVGQAAAFLSETETGKQVLRSARMRAEALRGNLQARAEGIRNNLNANVLQVQQNLTDTIYDQSKSLEGTGASTENVNIKGTSPTLKGTEPFIGTQPTLTTPAQASPMQKAYIGAAHYSQPGSGLLDGSRVQAIRAMIFGVSPSTQIVNNSSAEPASTTKVSEKGFAAVVGQTIGQPSVTTNPTHGGVSGTNTGVRVGFPSAYSHGQRSQKPERNFAIKFD